MKIFFVILIIVAQVSQRNVQAETCNGVRLNGIYHEVEVLKRRLDRPMNLAVDDRSNTLFFSHNKRDIWISASLNLETKEYNAIDDYIMCFSQAVDQNTQTVYIGGDQGLHIYDQNTKQLNLIGQQGLFVWYLYFSDVLYYVLHPNARVFTFENDVEKEFEELKGTQVYKLIIDREDDIIFNNETALYMQKLGTKDAVKYPEDVNVRALATNIYGEAYVGLSDGIYSLDKSRLILKKVFDVKDLFGLVFDERNNFIYSDGSKIVRLKRDEYKRC